MGREVCVQRKLHLNEITVTDRVTKTSADFDALMRAHAGLDQLAVHLAGDKFYSVASDCWGDTNDIQQNAGFRAGRHWTFDSDTGATLVWDVDNVPDERVDDTPKFLIQSTEARFDSRLNLHTPQEVWDLRPSGQAVRNINIDLQFSKAVDRWKAKGKKLEIGAVALGGDRAAIEHVHVTNYGALGHEAFPLYIQGAYGMYDRNLIAQLDPATHIFDDGVPDDQCSHITDCPVDGYCEDSNDQVTARFIAGSVGQRPDGTWQQHNRAFWYQSGNHTAATGRNMVQAHTGYQGLRGRVDKNTAECSILYYGDTYGSKGVVIDDNDHVGYIGVQLLLSPGGPCPEQYFHDDYTVTARNRFTTNGPNVLLDTLGATTDRRYIRGIKVDAALSLENHGAGVIRTGVAPASTNSGCNKLFRVFRR